MKVLVPRRGSIAGPERLRLAVAGLELRGHEVSWSGSGARRAEADVVLGWGGAAEVAFAGWIAGAHGMLLALDRGAVRRWNLADRWCMESLASMAVVEPAEAEELKTDGRLDAERVWSWSEAPPPTPDATHPDTEILERACERLVARHRGPGSRPAAFLDRDGTLVVEKGYLADPDQLELLPGVPAALRSLAAAGFALVVISNQSGVDRGLFPRSRVYDAMARLRSLLRRHGVELDAVYFCPHRPEAGCACRKPGPALLLEAARDLNLALRESVMIGDKLLDVAAGHRAGTRGVLVRTGYGREEESRMPDPAAIHPPDLVCEDLEEAASWILDGGGAGRRD